MAQRKFWGLWVLVWKVCVCVYRGVLRAVGRPCHLQCPVEEGTCGKWRDRLLMVRIEMQHLIYT